MTPAVEDYLNVTIGRIKHFQTVAGIAWQAGRVSGIAEALSVYGLLTDDELNEIRDYMQMAVLTLACWLADTDWAARISEKLDRYMK